MPDDSNWEDYYRRLEGRPPRPLLGAALERFPAGQAFRAVDLGSGDGTETLALLERGWTVTAIDAEASALSRLEARVPAALQERLEARLARFEDVDVPPAELIYAGFSLPFCPPEHFDDLWRRIESALPRGGVFAGQLFGVRDGWSSNEAMSFHTSEGVERLLSAFDVEAFDEIEQDGPSGSGPKHWHIFDVVARKR